MHQPPIGSLRLGVLHSDKGRRARVLTNDSARGILSVACSLAWQGGDVRSRHELLDRILRGTGSLPARTSTLKPAPNSPMQPRQCRGFTMAAIPSGRIGECVAFRFPPLSLISTRAAKRYLPAFSPNRQPTVGARTPEDARRMPGRLQASPGSVQARLLAQVAGRAQDVGSAIGCTRRYRT